ncbi:hypothetical protein PPTG_12518 [Phytophthora nicotianae INRA-310]|uniref:Uncharacterized protein n=1 Tax=Phytophthora nicotianae (strain INRA-310) TaxID=761204 RepID=W2Q551_PHYN3|nr:hypothetical protein PPTG_12518 [Phytophthora nicotianae INRA-310]ETN08001.1 hypothetical protein PPTG_12518 [Phytophthora nicotianae INRA-310]
MLELRIRIAGHLLLMMLGDVAGAFHHVPMHTDHVHIFAFRFDCYVIIDLSCGFVWCGSPAYDSLPGSLINNLYQRERPSPILAPMGRLSVTTGMTITHVRNWIQAQGVQKQIWRYVSRWRWCLVQQRSAKKVHDLVDKCEGSGTTLGYTRWHRIGASRQSFKDSKLLLDMTSCTQSMIHKLLGSLRYISTSFAPTRAFYQTFKSFRQDSTPNVFVDPSRTTYAIT